MDLSKETCLKAYEIYQSIWYNRVLGMVIVFNITGFFMLGITFKLLLYSQKFHLNLRILLLNITFGIFLRSFATTIRASYRIGRAIFVSDPCGYVTSLRFCLYESGIQSIPFAAVNNSFPIICLERCIATILSKKYEQKSFFKFYTIISGAVWGYAIYDSLYFAMSLTEAEAVTPAVFCSSVSGAKNIQYIDMINSTNFLCPFCSSVVFIILWNFCNWKKRGFLREKFPEHSLSERYQLKELMKTTQVICCLSILFSCLFNGQAFIITFLLKNGYFSDLKEFSIVKEIGSFSVMPIFINVFGATFFYHLKNELKLPHQKILSRKCKKTAPKVTETEAYFNLYASSWK